MGVGGVVVVSVEGCAEVSDTERVTRESVLVYVVFYWRISGYFFTDTSWHAIDVPLEIMKRLHSSTTTGITIRTPCASKAGSGIPTTSKVSSREAPNTPFETLWKGASFLTSSGFEELFVVTEVVDGCLPCE